MGDKDFQGNRLNIRPLPEAVSLIEKINATRKTAMIPYEKLALTKKIRSTWLRRSFDR